MFALLAACVFTPQSISLGPNIYVMRHLHTLKGTSDPSLTPEGQATAEALADWLAPDPPRAIFVSDTKRAKETVAPTAMRFGVIPTVYNPADTPALLSSVLAEKGTVLVVGHSNTVPRIIAALGGQPPAALVHEDFGDVWRISGKERTTIRTKLSNR